MYGYNQGCDLLQQGGRRCNQQEEKVHGAKSRKPGVSFQNGVVGTSLAPQQKCTTTCMECYPSGMPVTDAGLRGFTGSNHAGHPPGTNPDLRLPEEDRCSAQTTSFVQTVQAERTPLSEIGGKPPQIQVPRGHLRASLVSRPFKGQQPGPLYSLFSM